MMEGHAQQEDELQFMTVPETSLPSSVPQYTVGGAQAGSATVSHDPLAFIKQTRVSVMCSR